MARAAGAEAAALCAVVAVVANRNGRWKDVGYFSTLTAFCAIHTVCGRFIIRRTRWAWVVSTIFSFNVILWIINFIYGRNRWQELGNDAVGSELPDQKHESSRKILRG